MGYTPVNIYTYQKYLLSIFPWLPAKLACKVIVLWLVVCFIMLSEDPGRDRGACVPEQDT